MGNKKKSSQLGMPFGTANSRLRKSILFFLLKKHSENNCYRCGKIIESEKELSVEHIIPWQDNDPALFWDLQNISFSHLKCNVADARQPNKGSLKHPSSSAYRKGCRCSECKEIQKDTRAIQRLKGINT